MRYRYIQPGNEDEFEDFCVRFYRHLLERGSLLRYGKRGETQDGIDIIDPIGLEPVVAIQCKNHEPTKTITPREIKAEVARAESSPHRIDRYIIATTARKSRKAQDAVLRLNQRKGSARLFTVEIHFWEDISTYLNGFGRAIAEAIFYGGPCTGEFAASVQSGAGRHISVAAAFGDDVKDADFYPEIASLVKNRKREAAEHEIGKLPDPEQGKTLGKHQRYALLSLKAKLALDRADFDECARLFTLAYETCPELQQAKENRILALDLTGQRREAFAEATRLLERGVGSASIVRILIATAETPSDIAPYQDKVDDHILKSEDVNLALVERHLKWNQPTIAAASAQRAVDIAPQSAHALFARGMVAHHCAFNGEWQQRSERLTAAIRYYSEAIAAAERDNYAALLPEILTNRGRVYGVLGKHSEAAEDFRKAVTTSKTPSLYATSAVSFFLHVEDYDSALELLPKLDAASDEGVFLTTVTEYYHAPHGEKREHILALKRLGNRKFPRATEVRFHCVHWAIELGDFELARRCVTKTFVRRRPFQGHLLNGWIELEAGNEPGARESADLAIKSSSRSAVQQEIACLAGLLVRLNQDDEALPLLEQAATPGVLNEDCKRLLECAQRLDRHDTLLRICSELHQTGQQDNLVRKMQVQLLSHYAPANAYSLAKEFRQFDEQYFLAASNYLAVRLGRAEEVEFDDTSLPKPGDFEPCEAYLVVTPYVEARRFEDALIFVYQQLRRHFCDEKAHGQYAWFVVHYGKNAAIPVAVEVVDEVSAVHLENCTTGDKRWVVIEDDQPDVARSEFSTPTVVVQALLGRQVGDTVDLRGPAVQLQQERIIEIQSKYVHLFQDVMREFQNRFPNSGAIQSIHLGGEDDLNLAALARTFRDRQQHVDKVVAYYHEQLISLQYFAELLAVSERHVLTWLTTHDEWSIRVIECTPAQFEESSKAGLGASRVVLDLSAILTLSRLNAWNSLDDKLEYLVAHSTVDKIGGWLHELTEQEGLTSGYGVLDDDGCVRLKEVTPEHWESELAEVRTIMTEVSSRCIVKSSMSVANLDPKRRDLYIKFCGRDGLESLSVAKDEDVVLWSDDQFMGVLAELDFGVRRTWTQLVLKVFENAGKIDSDKYKQSVARLAAWNYVATIWHPCDVIAAGRLCDWDVKAWPFRQCIKLIGARNLPLDHKARVAVDILKSLRRSECIALKQSAVVQAVLDAVGDPKGVLWMLQHLDDFFRVDFLSANFLKTELQYWLRLR